METMTLTEIVKKLVGEITPAVSSHVDEKRYENLKTMCQLVNDLVTEIDNVSYRNKDRVEYSMKVMGEYAHEFLTKTLGIV